jgi:hypothetical protein
MPSGQQRIYSPTRLCRNSPPMGATPTQIRSKASFESLPDGSGSASPMRNRGLRQDERIPPPHHYFLGKTSPTPL